jgi:hypothetical protein
MTAETSEALQVKLVKWRMNGRPIPVRVEGENGATGSGQVYVQEWGAKERSRRGLKTLGMLWGLGAFTILFPIIHFILPPALLIAGPIFAWKIANQKSVVLGGSGKCPKCGATFEVVRANYFKPEDTWPLRDACGECRTDLTIERFDATAAQA